MTLLRILCLHGYRQNGNIFREKTGSFRKLLKKYVAEFVYIDAPHLIPIQDNTNEQDTGATASNRSNERGWWFSSCDQTYDPLATTSCDQGFEQSLEYVMKYIDEQQIPFDGLLAFSQGAAFATLLLTRFASTKYPFRFVILVASFKSGQEQHQFMYNNLQIDLPSLHVIGLGDRVIPCLMSENLANEYYKNAEILRHDGGHFIPTTSEAKLTYIQFLERFL
ncbi:unnamed protein product [Rotaria sordida]|uniref:Serine hydrolase domain-containing protein n=1 Tax=Rotaria sordida TaxID=392033 RepID=A0A819A0V2_9BILA|nr:unnamed protein product [Rotaria sordida]CAF0752847.1 unnamed protein product [Rotaria sordida]CAF0877036.1 unnamed protein product [Rotaria sordida]CAF3771425.1 unnamed protein product [Rotaria sordida]